MSLMPRRSFFMPNYDTVEHKIFCRGRCRRTLASPFLPGVNCHISYSINHELHRTKRMVSIKRQVAFATSSLFFVLIGVRYYIQAWKLLLSYLPGNGARDLQLDRNGSGNFTVLQSQIASSDQEWGRQKYQRQHDQKSPACHPHFRFPSHESNNTRAWSEDTKFKRMYFYHARKAGGTSLASYFSMVARHHGLEFKHAEYVESEEPGTHELPTFYVTHLREPVSQVECRLGR
jgi:hypothetical protein